MSRLATLIAASTATIAIVVSSIAPMPLKLLWNASASTPVGLYGIGPVEYPSVGDRVVVDVPGPLAMFLSTRGYLPMGVPLIKPVAAIAGQRVCRTGHTISVDGTDTTEALDRDRWGRALPTWQGCRVIAAGEVFLMNSRVRDSLDGRYFEAIPMRAIIGRATPLYTDENGDGHFEWRAKTPPSPRERR